MASNIDNLNIAVHGLIEQGLSTDMSALSSDDKFSMLKKAKAICALSKEAAVEMKNLSEDEVDQLSLRHGDELKNILGAE